MHALTSSASAHPLLDHRRRSRVERAVSAARGRPWSVTTWTDLHDLSSHPAAILSDGELSVFAKLSTAPTASDQFEVELRGLGYLAEHAGVRTPHPIGDGVIAVDDGAVLLMEAVAAVERDDDAWREIGRTIARIHQIRSDVHGFPSNGWFGPLRLDNRPVADGSWATFYAERRVWPRLVAAIESGFLPTEIARRVERLVDRVPELCGSEPVPTLLHGDAQQNNFISTAAGAVVIDPAVQHGHPEIDLALLDYFAPVPDAVFGGYREVAEIDPGFPERRELWRIFAYLAIVQIAGAPYLPRLVSALDRYVP